MQTTASLTVLRGATSSPLRPASSCVRARVAPPPWPIARIYSGTFIASTGTW